MTGHYENKEVLLFKKPTPYAEINFSAGGKAYPSDFFVEALVSKHAILDIILDY
jgi:hypothetical protein